MRRNRGLRLTMTTEQSSLRAEDLDTEHIPGILFPNEEKFPIHHLE